MLQGLGCTFEPNGGGKWQSAIETALLQGIHNESARFPPGFDSNRDALEGDGIYYRCRSKDNRHLMAVVMEAWKSRRLQMLNIRNRAIDRMRIVRLSKMKLDGVAL